MNRRPLRVGRVALLACLFALAGSGFGGGLPRATGVDRQSNRQPADSPSSLMVGEITQVNRPQHEPEPMPVNAAFFAAAAPAARRTGGIWGPYGRENFPEMYRNAVEAYFKAEGQYRSKKYADALATLDALWAKYPRGGKTWVELYDVSFQVSGKIGAQYGHPAAYYNLQMLDECARFRVRWQGKTLPEPATIHWTALLIAKARGLKPMSIADLRKKTGRETVYTMEPQITDHDSKLLFDLSWQLREYVMAMTDGKLTVKLEPFIYQKEVKVGVWMNDDGSRNARMLEGEYEVIWPNLPTSLRSQTDWWWTIFPGNKPLDVPALATTPYNGGGMRFAPDGSGRPMFVTDDTFLCHKPREHGFGEYTMYERRAYFPQFLQHEFFHHLFGCYPDFKLEAKSHQWFDRSTWPKNFRGEQEPDYYAEALHKLIQPKGTPPPAERLKYAVGVPPDLLVRLAPQMLAGNYQRRPAENGWHEGTLSLDAGGKTLTWRNKANVSWKLTPDFPNAVLSTGPDSPYFDRIAGKQFGLIVNPGKGNGPPVVTGFRYEGEWFIRVER